MTVSGERVDHGGVGVLDGIIEITLVPLKICVSRVTWLREPNRWHGEW